MPAATATPKRRTVEAPQPQVDVIADLASIQRDAEAEQKALRDELNAMKVAHAKGASPDAERRRMLLSAFGETLDVYTADVTKLVKRLQAAAKIAKVAATTPQIDDLSKRTAAAAEELRIAREEWEARERVLEVAFRDLDEQRDRLSATKRETEFQCDRLLVQTAHPSIADELASLEQRRAELTHESNGLNRDCGVDELERRNTDAAEIAKQRRIAVVDAFQYLPPPRANIVEARKRDSRLAEIKSEIASIDAERQRLEALRLDPVGGMLLGTPETPPEQQAASVWSFWESLRPKSTVR